MEAEGVEGEPQDRAGGVKGMAVAGVILADPVADSSGLADAAAHVAQVDPPDECVILPPEDEEGISEAEVEIPVVDAQPAAERAAGQVIGGPGRLPGLKEFPAVAAKLGPVRIVGHPGRTQHHPLSGEGEGMFLYEPIEYGHAPIIV